jgi:hypothetical protein
MTPREYIETAMKLAELWATWQVAGDWQVKKDALESHLREHLDEIIEAAYDKGLDDRDED